MRYAANTALIKMLQYAESDALAELCGVADEAAVDFVPLLTLVPVADAPEVLLGLLLLLPPEVLAGRETVDDDAVRGRKS
jgi:hypothetical protein